MRVMALVVGILLSLKPFMNPEQGVSEGRLTLADPHHGAVDLSWKGRYIWGVVDLPDEDLRSTFMKRFGEEIQKRK